MKPLPSIGCAAALSVLAGAAVLIGPVAGRFLHRFHLDLYDEGKLSE